MLPLQKRFRRCLCYPVVTEGKPKQLEKGGRKYSYGLSKCFLFRLCSFYRGFRVSRVCPSPHANSLFAASVYCTEKATISSPAGFYRRCLTRSALSGILSKHRSIFPLRGAEPPAACLPFFHFALTAFGMLWGLSS